LKSRRRDLAEKTAAVIVGARNSKTYRQE